jgi:hypothetical protein
MFAFEGFGPDVFVPFLVFSIPIIAIVGGITAGIVKTISRHRIIELAQRERIAMIERGLDPSKLPPLPLSEIADVTPLVSHLDSARNRSQGLMIGGLVTLAVGVSLGVLLYNLADTGSDSGVWSVGLIPAAIGIALLISAFIVRPKNGN